MKRRRALCAVAVTVAAIITTTAASPTVSAETTTTVVTSDENPTPAQVAAAEPSSGWNIGRDGGFITPFEFVDGVSSIGDGALRVGPIGNDLKGPADKFISEYVIGVETSEFASISFDVLVDTPTPAADANEFYLNIYTSAPVGDPLYSAFYNCRFDVVPTTAPTGAFRTVSLAAADTTVVDGSLNVVPRNGYACPTSISGMPAGSVLSFVSLNVGDTSTSDQDVAGYFDNVVIEIGADTEIFDFEAPEPAASGIVETIVVTEDENPTTEQAAAFEPSSGWDIGRDVNNLAPFEFNEDEASIGNGALRVGPVTNTIKGAADKLITEYWINQPTSAFESISYDILVDTPTPAADANEFYLNIYTNLPGSTSFYECRFDVVPPTASDTLFTTITYNATDDANNVRERGGTLLCPEKMSEMPAGSTISFISLSVGDTSASVPPSDQDVSGYYDNVVIEIGGNTTTFDFEAPEAGETGVETIRKVVEDEDDPTGWDIVNDGFTTVFDFNDDNASIGAGALQVGPIGNDINGNADKFISSHIIDVLTSDFESVSFDVLLDGTTPDTSSNQFYINLYTNMPGSTSFYDCRFDAVANTAYLSGTLLNATTFTTIELAADDEPIVVPRGGATCPTTVAGMPAGSTVSFVSLNVGDTSINDAGVGGYLDNVILKTAGNTETFDFDIDEPPVFPVAPADVTVETAPGGSDAVVTFDLPAATDDLSTPTVDCVPASGDTFPIGVTTVTCTATDSADQTAEVTFNVVVLAVAAADEPPSFESVPDDIAVSTAPGATGVVVEFDLPVATDDDTENPPTVVCDPASGTAFEVGDTTVTCTATDSGDQTAEVTFTVTVTATAASDLVAIDPARLLETRTGENLTTIDGEEVGVGRSSADTFLDVPIAGRGGVPADAIGAVLNVAAIQPDAAGFVTLYPCTDEIPTAASLNYEAGVNISNATFVDLSDDGDVCLYTSNVADYTIDVVGYLPAESRLGLVEPARFLETRDVDGLITIDGEAQGDGVVTGDTFVEVQITGRDNVPDGAVAAMVNVAAVQPTANGFLTLYPCTDEVPLAASLNYTPGTNISNATMVELSATGSLCVYASSTTHVTLDVVGFAPPGTDVGTVEPARLLETRQGDDKATIDGEEEGAGISMTDSFLEVQIAGRAGVPATADSVILNLAAVQPLGVGFATLYPCTDDVPLAASINYTAGVNISNATLVDLSDDGTVCVYTSTPTHLTLDVLGYVNTSVDDAT
ncbi:MAG: HYR domain-containing protein [Ilumatobacter sp.]|uniref:HYR domain-containing protein n=1 Tax=Ilumatobacter sp. TaxID=1967498 RepID=UPI00391A6CB9